MARKSALYFLFSENKKPLYVDSSGHVVEGTGNYTKTDGSPAHLSFSPDGWKESLVKYGRNVKYFGLFRDFTEPMRFVGDGAKILRERMWRGGVEAVCHMGVARLDRTALPYSYYSWYLTELNFSKFIQTTTGVQIEALEGGLSKLLKANEGTVYSIPIASDPEHILVKMDGMEFDFGRVFYIIPDQELYAVPNYYLGVSEQSREGNIPPVRFKDTQPMQSSTYPNEDFVIEVDTAQDVRIHGKITLLFNTSDTIVFRAEVNDGSGAGSTQTDLVNTTGSPQGPSVTQEFNFDQTISIPAGSRLHLKIFTGSSAGAPVQVTVKSGEVNIDYSYRHPESNIPALRPFTLFQRLVEKISDGQYQADSTLLSAMDEYCITSGDAIRGISDPVIKTSISDFFKTFLSRFSVGLTVHNDKLKIEALADFFQSSIIADIGQVDECSISVADDLMFNTLKAGYAKKDYTDANGRYEVNQGQIWSTPMKRVIRELDLSSPYRADPFGIELLRINFSKKQTTDTEGDNDTFLLHISSSNTGSPGRFDAEVTGPHAYSGTSEVIYDNVDGGADFTADVDKKEFTYGGTIPQRVRVDMSMTPTGGGGVLSITASILVNGVSVTSSSLPIGATNGITYDVDIVPGDILSIQVAGMAGSLNVNQSTLGFDYITNGIYELNRPAYTTVTGIPHPASAFNLELSPKRGILNNEKYLHSLLDRQDTGRMKLESADKNKELYTELAGVVVDEDEDIQIGNLGDKLFQPYYFNFKTKVPINLVALLKSNPWGKIQFTYNEKTWYGFMWDGGIKPGQNESQNWKLLCAPENDLSKFDNR